MDRSRSNSPTARSKVEKHDVEGETTIKQEETSASAKREIDADIIDLSSPLHDRLDCVYTFDLGSNYHIRIGPVNFFSQGGTFDAFQLGRRVLEKEGGKPRLITLNLPIRLCEAMFGALSRLHTQFQEERRSLDGPTLLSMLEKMKIRDNKPKCKDLDVSTFGGFVAPKQAYRIAQDYVVQGETVMLPKGLQFEAITFIREAKKSANGKDCKEFKMSVPLRMLPMLTASAWLACHICGLKMDPLIKPEPAY